MSQRTPYKKSYKTDTLGGRLRTARLAAGLTQSHLSELIHQRGSQWTTDTTRVMISRIENGDDVGEQAALLGLAARVLGVQPKRLIGDGVQSRTGDRKAESFPDACSSVETNPQQFTLCVRLKGWRAQAVRAMKRHNIPFVADKEQGGTTIGRIPQQYRRHIIVLHQEADDGPRPYPLGAILDYWPRSSSKAADNRIEAGPQ
jgi:transcriptional regulator with XRE-family HTH domain